MIAELANTYIQSPAAKPSALELENLRLWIGAQYRALPVPVRFTAQELTLAQAAQLYIHRGLLLVSTAHSEHPWLSRLDNARFRAIHDWHHVIGGLDDSLTGEIGTYQIAKSTAPQGIWWILFSEIVLQAAACIHTGRFQQQKLVRV